MKIPCGLLRGSRLLKAPRKPGWKPPARLLRMLKAIHPRIHLTWAPTARKWVLMERTVDGYWQPVTQLEGRPTLRNTVIHLNEMRKIMRDHKRFIRRLEEAEKKRLESNSRADDLLQEGHERMWHLLGSSERVSFSGSGRHSS